MFTTQLKRFVGSGLMLSVASCGGEAPKKATELPMPNLIFILADDLGYGDVGYQGQEKFSTPNIDRLASEGLIFTRHYSGSTVCAPSRSSLMTGQHTGQTYIRGNREHQPEGQEPLPEGTLTLAKILQQQGYVTGAFGKWGLGYPGSEGEPKRQGFDRFFGFNCQRLGHHYYPYHLWNNDQKVILAGNAGKAMGEYAPEVIHREALKFMEEHRNTPFFMFYPTIIPHAELFAPEAYMERYRGKLLPEKAYVGVDDGDSFRQGPYGSQPEAHAAHAAMIAYLDDQVGELMAKLKELGLDKNTLVIFTSDNGPHLEGGADPDYFNSNAGLRGYKRDLYEGGIRVPFVAHWPGKIGPGITHHISAFWDFLPTVVELTGYAGPMPDPLNGISFLPTLMGQNDRQKQHEYLYWEFHERGLTQAVLMGDWKLIRKSNGSPAELYNLSTDRSETTNLSDTYKDELLKLEAFMDGARSESDIWQVR